MLSLKVLDASLTLPPCCLYRWFILIYPAWFFIIEPRILSISSKHGIEIFISIDWPIVKIFVQAMDESLFKEGMP
ncbi:unnamed protein product [Fusarium graminearum]|nr:unnamed protein product [Fusarium graminearum]CAG1960074.1 unnamed protein product [Fusarium graminearum]VTO84373.1 unnamed protein product [Fusarium graminearum]